MALSGSYNRPLIGTTPRRKAALSYELDRGLCITLLIMFITLLGVVRVDWQVLIGQYVFPIACCVYLFHSQEKERERHKEESDKWIEAVNNNTRVIETLNERLTHGISKD